MPISESKPWSLVGYDTFSSEWYPLPGSYVSEQEAKQAARKRLEELERGQPTAQSGGQEGVQDQVFISGPGEILYRYLPEKNVRTPRFRVGPWRF